MTAVCHLLFVYGTLRRRHSHAMARFLAERGRFVAEVKMAGRLYNLGRFPGMIPPQSDGDWTFGDLYDLSESPGTLEELDRYETLESSSGAYFERALSDVIHEDGRREQAWVYWYHGPVKEVNRIASGQYV